MNKRQLIDEIRQFNTSVRPQFLTQFDETALQQYLSSLQNALTKQKNQNLRIRHRVRQESNLRMVS